MLLRVGSGSRMWSTDRGALRWSKSSSSGAFEPSIPRATTQHARGGLDARGSSTTGTMRRCSMRKLGVSETNVKSDRAHDSERYCSSYPGRIATTPFYGFTGLHTCLPSQTQSRGPLCAADGKRGESWALNTRREYHHAGWLDRYRKTRCLLVQGRLSLG